MEKESIEKQVLHLRTVEKLTFRQIAQHLSIGRRHIRRILGGEGITPGPLKRPSLLERYQNLIAHWYSQYPRLKAIQIYARLKPYGYERKLPHRSELYQDLPREEEAGLPHAYILTG